MIQRGKQILGLNKRLDQEKQRSESSRETARELSRESLRLHREVRILRESEARARSLSEEVRWLRFAVDGAEARNGALKAKLAKRIAEKNTLSKPIAGVQLRTALRRSRRQKETIKSQSLEIRRLRRAVAGVGATPDPGSQTSRGSDRGIEVSVDQVAALRKALRRSRLQKATIQLLRKENARLHKSAKMSRNRIETLEAGLARLRATGAVLSRTLYGRKSEKQETPRSGRRAASSAAPPAMAAPSGRDSRNAPRSTIRRPMRASAHGADSPMRQTVHRPLPLPRLQDPGRRPDALRRHDRDGWPLAMLGFSTAAWKLAPRDKFIGWTPQLREKNLPLVVGNPRFLILPWITIPNLGSHILAIIRRRLSDDWTERYNTSIGRTWSVSGAPWTGADKGRQVTAGTLYCSGRR